MITQIRFRSKSENELLQEADPPQIIFVTNRSELYLCKCFMDIADDHIFCSCPPEHFELWKKEKPSCLMIDSSLHNVEKMIVSIKRDRRTSHVPLILICNETERDRLDTFILAGIDDYFFPPFKDNEIIGRIDMNIKRSQRDVNCNPLTKLPGNSQIEDEIRANPDKVLLHVDIDNFKKYNDAHGFAKGDEMILATARMLSSLITHNDFLGHIGGDDFIFVTTKDRAKELEQVVQEKFKFVTQELAVSVALLTTAITK